EKLITLAKKGDLNSRRRVLDKLGPASKAQVRPEADDPVHPEKADERHVIVKLFNEIAPRYVDRPGGYTRVLKRTQRRLGDAGHTAFLELVKPGDRPKNRKKPAPAPAAPPESQGGAPAQGQSTMAMIVDKARANLLGKLDRDGA